jgi:hypothetical protein
LCTATTSLWLVMMAQFGLEAKAIVDQPMPQVPVEIVSRYDAVNRASQVLIEE